MPAEMTSFIKRAAEKSGFVRESYNEERLPTEPDNICILPFFGDFRSTFVVSSLLANRYRTESKASKYFIVCSWPGMAGFFPQADEFWAIKDVSICKEFYSTVSGLENNSEIYTRYIRKLNQFFEDILTIEEIQTVYHNGLLQGFWDKFRHVKRYLPQVPSSTLLGNSFNQEILKRSGYKVLICPLVYGTKWVGGKSRSMKISIRFWEDLVSDLLKSDIVPIIYQNSFSYELAGKFLEQCVYLKDPHVHKLFSAMRKVGCVLDPFTGLSRFAIAARTPYLACEDRSKYMNLREFEIDDLCAYDLPKQYIFNFATIIDEESYDRGKTSVLRESMLNRLNNFLPTLDRDTWPNTSESDDIVPYDIVRSKKIKRLGAKFVKVTRD